MKNTTKTRILLSSILLLFGTLLVAPAMLVHGQSSGVVCLVSSGSTSCPSSPATITGTVGSQLRVSVFIQNSSGFNGFDITVNASSAILQPSSVDLTGTVLGPPPLQILSECIGGVQQASGGPPCPSTNTPNTVELAALNCLGCGPGPTPTTGLLFTAIYNVVASTTSTPIDFQTGCSNGSVAGTTDCVAIANGGVNPVPETVQTAVFTTSSTGDFTISASPATLSIHRGSTATSTITFASVGFAGTISLSTSVSPSTSRGPTATLSVTSVTLSSGGTATVTLTVTTTKHTGTGTYTVTVTGTSGSISHSTTVTTTVTH